jgi:cysteine synthase
MINAHKVLAAYGCLAPRIVTGQFNPQHHKALWPSTGNYCRGGVAISRIMNCHGVAILPEGMSAERFDWLDKWALDPQDIIRTAGCESNVKEIYDKCNELDRSPENIIFNQFCEFGNHLVHYRCTGKALEKTFASVSEANGGLSLRAFVSSTGSAGTIAAGDYLKDTFGTKIVATEALECPTLLFNGFGEHNIQGIGDKHIPLIHNVMNTDLVAAISDRATDSLGLLFNSDAGKKYLSDRRGLSTELIDALSGLGLSSICNVLAAIKTARYYQLGADEAVITVATDDATMYGSEREKANEELFGNRFDQIHAAEVYGQHVMGQEINHLEELNHLAKHRVFNLGYFTWVEQQGVSLEEFNARRSQNYWRALRPLLTAWDKQIVAFNEKTGVLASL